MKASRFGLITSIVSLVTGILEAVLAVLESDRGRRIRYLVIAALVWVSGICGIALWALDRKREEEEADFLDLDSDDDLDVMTF